LIRNPHILEAFERELLRRSPPDPVANFKMMDWMFQEAKSLGAMPRQNRLEGIDFKIDFARRLNVRKHPGGPVPGA
jgi:hypothetical protein